MSSKTTPILCCALGEQAPGSKSCKPARCLSLCLVSDAGATRNALLWHSHGHCCLGGRGQKVQRMKMGRICGKCKPF